jgi:hypothetical protein
MNRRFYICQICGTIKKFFPIYKEAKLCRYCHYKYDNPVRKKENPQEINHIYRFFNQTKFKCKAIPGKKRPLQVYREWETFKHFERWALRHGYFEGCKLKRINKKAGLFPKNVMIIFPDGDIATHKKPKHNPNQKTSDKYKV